MTITHTASAPGKLVLVGEYAVLEGAPAISAAVNIFASATLQPVTAGKSELHIRNCGNRYEFTVAPGGVIEWSADPGDRGALLDAALQALADRDLLKESLASIILELCTRDFYSDEKAGSAQKIGIGSSAAMAVALTSVIQDFLGDKPTIDACLDVHSRFQQGKGSGIDVATSWFGGVIGMQPNGGDVPVIEQLAWPQGLTVVPVWTGEPASTTVMLRRLERFKECSGDTCDSIMQRLVMASQDTCDCWRSGTADDIAAALDEYGDLLRELDAAAGIGIWSACHEKLNGMARKAGVGYKPSGAGGGDFGLAFSCDAERLQAYLRQVDAMVVPQPDQLGWSDRGLSLNSTEIAPASKSFSE
jgi:phosphomevalonate kinase